ncbi:MAG: hypothetical protein L0219_08755 [Phycisphaerales bacterium]|nr:hypothetical protein [Phycisphaerales bacterium]
MEMKRSAVFAPEELDQQTANPVEGQGPTTRSPHQASPWQISMAEPAASVALTSSNRMSLKSSHSRPVPPGKNRHNSSCAIGFRRENLNNVRWPSTMRAVQAESGSEQVALQSALIFLAEQRFDSTLNAARQDVDRVGPIGKIGKVADWSKKGDVRGRRG